MGRCVGVGVTSDNVYGNENKIQKKEEKEKYIIFSVTHAHADNVDKLLLLLFELAAYLQRMMREKGREEGSEGARGQLM